jgi:hypothetical protein
MPPRKRVASTKGPVSIAVGADHRERLHAEARRRGLGFSSTIRTLALERLSEIEEERQLARARKWQLERALETVEEIERGDVKEVSWDEIDKIFDDALEKIRRRSEAGRR